MGADHDVVIISGPPGVGKTTVSRSVARILPGTVCIHGDELRAFAPDDARDLFGGGSTCRAAAALTLEYLTMGASRVLFDYVFSRPSHVAHFMDRLGRNQHRVLLLTLWAPLEVVRHRESERPGREPLGAAVEECWTEIAKNRSCLGDWVEVNGLSLAEVTSRLVTLIGAK